MIAVCLSATVFVGHVDAWDSAYCNGIEYTVVVASGAGTVEHEKRYMAMDAEYNVVSAGLAIM